MDVLAMEANHEIHGLVIVLHADPMTGFGALADLATCSRPNGTIFWLSCEASSRDRPKQRRETRARGRGRRRFGTRLGVPSGCATPVRRGTLAEGVKHSLAKGL
jgi:hypothetical protein